MPRQPTSGGKPKLSISAASGAASYFYVAGIGIAGTGTVVNYGQIRVGGLYYPAAQMGSGRVTNGSSSDTAATMLSLYGRALDIYHTGSVMNFGHIAGVRSGSVIDQQSVLTFGVNLGSGTVVNGTVSDTTATIYGNSFGVYLDESDIRAAVMVGRQPEISE